MEKKKPTEQDLAAHVVAMLHHMGWEVFQEVEGCGGGRADIVARNGKIIWVIECKMSFGLAVIEQAWNHVRYQTGHYVSVAVPGKSVGWFAEDICLKFGIGIIGVNMNGGTPLERLRPKFHRKSKCKARLCEEQKTWCKAGSAAGGHYTSFKGTCRNLVNLVRQSPEGVAFAEAIKTIDHHYSSFGTAKSCLRGFIGTVIPELRAETVGGKLVLFYNAEIDTSRSAT